MKTGILIIYTFEAGACGQDGKINIIMSQPVMMKINPHISSHDQTFSQCTNRQDGRDEGYEASDTPSSLSVSE